MVTASTCGLDTNSVSGNMSMCEGISTDTVNKAKPIDHVVLTSFEFPLFPRKPPISTTKSLRLYR